MARPTAAPSLLGVFAHPDDESLLAGGVLTQYAASGARTAVVTATWTADSHRAPELAEALDVLGAGAPRLLGYADARNPASAPGVGAVRLVDAPLDEAVGRLVAHIREVRPDIVIGHDALGQLTGFPVKSSCSRLVPPPHGGARWWLAEGMGRPPPVWTSGSCQVDCALFAGVM